MNAKNFIVGAALASSAFAVGSCASEELPNPENINISEVARTTLDSIENLGYLAVAGSVVFLGLQTKDRASRIRTTLAVQGYHDRDYSVGRKILAGAMLPAAAATVIGSSLAIEEEIRSGPNRMVDTIAELLDDENPTWTLQEQTDHFMNASSLISEEVKEIQEASSKSYPFSLDLAQIEFNNDVQTGLIVGLPAEGKDRLIDASYDADITEDKKMAIVDASSTYQNGDIITIRDEEYEVAGIHAKPSSLLNREVVFTPLDDTSEIYGVVSSEDDLDDLRELTREENKDYQAVSTTELKASNEDFWEGNVSALMLVLMMSGIALGSSAIYGLKRSQDEMSEHVIGSLRGVGLGMDDMAKIEGTRAIMQSAKGAAIGFIAANGLVEVANSGITGFNAKLGVGQMIATGGILLTADLAGVGLLLNKTRKKSPVDQMKTH